MYICEHCKKEVKSLSALHQHLKKYHEYESIIDTTYYDINYLGLKHPDCPICNNKVRLVNNVRIFAETCGNQECKRLLYKQKIKTYYNTHPEAIEKHRNDRVNYLLNKQHFEVTAWGKRSNSQFSFLEQWFVEKIIIPYNLGSLFDIVNDYSVYPYFLDFAFINASIDVELDGRCHFQNGEDRINHDIKRDAILKDKGWHIYRISYDDVEHNELQTIDAFISFINNIENISEKELGVNYYTYQVIKDKKQLYLQSNKEKRILNKLQRHEYIKSMLIQLEHESNIDFSIFGWSTKAIKYLNTIGYKTSKHGVVHLLRKYYPEFFINNNVYLRKGTIIDKNY